MARRKVARARWSPVPRPSSGPSSRNTSQRHNPWAARRWSRSTALGVSPATVRNVMAELETAEYLDHPHTSAGRVPTDKGYRLYVESIAEAVALAPVEQLMIRHQFGQVEYASEQWFRLAAATLASSTHVAGIATAAKPPSCRVRRIDLVAAGHRMASLVVVLADGPVKQVLLAADRRVHAGGVSMRSAAGWTACSPADPPRGGARAGRHAGAARLADPLLSRRPSSASRG